MNYTTRDPDNTYVIWIEDNADQPEVHLRCYDAESTSKIDVYIQKTSLPDWMVDGYHKLKVAGNGVDLELSDGWAVKRGEVLVLGRGLPRATAKDLGGGA